MTPYEIDILLHYYAHADDHPDVTRQPPIFRPTMVKFIEAGLVEWLQESDRDSISPQVYRLLTRGRVYCEALQRGPLPVQVWVIPGGLDEALGSTNKLGPNDQSNHESS